MTSEISITSEAENAKPASITQSLARIYAKRGWRVVPLHDVTAGHCSCSKGAACPSSGKHPRLNDWVTRASNDLAVISDWFEQWPNTNIGVITGEAFFVLDVDPDKGGADSLAALTAEHGPLPRTVQALTGSRGDHYLFALPDFTVTNTAGKLGPGLDTRGSGGQIVVAPSVSGKGTYQWVNKPFDAPIAPAPAWLLAKLRPHAPAAPLAERQTFAAASNEVLEQAGHALDVHGPAIEGKGGDQHTFVAASILSHDFALTEAEAWPLIVEWNETCSPPWSESDLRAKLRNGAKHASGVYGSKRTADARATAEKWISDFYGSGKDPEDLVKQVRALRFSTAVQRELVLKDLQSATNLSQAAIALPKVYLSAPASSLSGDAEALARVMVAPTEENVARLFEREHAESLRYCKEWSAWLEWSASVWRPERTDLAFDYARELSRKANFEGKASPAKASFARGVEAFARASRTFATTSSQWDCDSWILNTPGGIVDLKTGHKRAHVSTDYVTKITRVAPQRMPTPVLDKFLREITCGDADLANYLQRALGSALSGAVSDHVLHFWTGEGSNGKNTLGDTVADTVGSYAKTIPTETLMSSKHERHPTEMATMQGLRFAFSSEVPEGSRWNESRIKSLTGDATITARFMRGDFFEFPRTHKHFVYGNSRPQLAVVDLAMRRRLHVVPFKALFSDELGNKDPLLPEKLRAEGPGILQWLIEGHMEWLRDGRLTRCEAVRRESDDYFASQSTPDMWLAENCTLLACDERPTGTIEKASVLYANFNLWKDLRGEAPMSQTRWGEWMSTRFTKIVGAGVRYRGVQLK